jgi:hypothetical protein
LRGARTHARVAGRGKAGTSTAGVRLGAACQGPVIAGSECFARVPVKQYNR